MRSIPIPESNRPPRGLLVLGDNLGLLSALPDSVADLIVTDPPFFTGRQRTGSSRSSQPTEPALQGPPPAFDDRWPSMDAYLAFLRPRLLEMHRILDNGKGSMVLHLDYHAVHAVKIEMDGIFGEGHLVNEIIWHYTGGGRSRRNFSRKHDTLLWYAKGAQWTFNIDTVRVPYSPTSGYARGGIVSARGKRYRPHPLGTPVDDVWDIPMVNPLSKERLGFPTQKPERLLERIIRALSLEDDLIIDPFCGSGTTAAVAARLKRRWITCDCCHEAIGIARRRLEGSAVTTEGREGFAALRLS